MIDKLLHRKRPLGKLTPLNSREIIQNIIDFIKDNSDKKHIKTMEYEKEVEYDELCLSCHCGWRNWKRIYPNWETKEESYYNAWMFYFYQHVCYEIRTKASEEHIDILIKVFGKENVVKLLKMWGERNIIIGNALKEIARELEHG